MWPTFCVLCHFLFSVSQIIEVDEWLEPCVAPVLLKSIDVVHTQARSHRHHHKCILKNATKMTLIQINTILYIRTPSTQNCFQLMKIYPLCEEV